MMMKSAVTITMIMMSMKIMTPTKTFCKGAAARNQLTHDGQFPLSRDNYHCKLGKQFILDILDGRVCCDDGGKIVNEFSGNDEVRSIVLHCIEASCRNMKKPHGIISDHRSI